MFEKTKNYTKKRPRIKSSDEKTTKNKSKIPMSAKSMRRVLVHLVAQKYFKDKMISKKVIT